MRRLDLNNEEARRFAVRAPVIEGPEAIEFLPPGDRHPGRPLPDHHGDSVGEAPQPALPLEAASERAPHGRVGAARLSPVRGRSVGQAHPRPDPFSAPLGIVHEPLVQGRDIVRLHPCDPPASGTDTRALSPRRCPLSQLRSGIGEPAAFPTAVKDVASRFARRGLSCRMARDDSV